MTVAVFVMSPDTWGITVNAMVAALLPLTLPSVPITGLALVFKEPCEVVADMIETLEGSVSDRMTFKADIGLLLVTVMV